MTLMLRTWLIYIIVFIASFATFCLAPLKSQYIFMKVAQSYNTTGRGQTSCYGNVSTEVDMLVARDSSRWTLVLNICTYIPASIVGFLVTSWSDKVGRKIAMTVPATGMILTSLSFALTIWFNWPLETLYICNIVSGLSGYYLVLILQGTAFLSDVADAKRRGILFVILESFVGVGGGIAGVLSGIWLNAEGYFQPIVASGILSTVVLILIFFLPDSTRIKQENNKTKEEEKKSLLSSDVTQSILENHTIGNDVQIRERSSLITNNAHPLYESCDHPMTSDITIPSKKSTKLDFARSVWNVYTNEYSHCEKCHGPRDGNEKSLVDRCCHGGGLYPGRIWRLWIFLISENVFLFVLAGTTEFQITFNLSFPLCFTPVLIGAQLGMKFFLIGMAPFIVMIFQKLLSMSNKTIILSGFITFVISNVTMAFATKPFITFIATSVLVLVYPSRPFIQAEMSSMVSETEQGAVYALASFGDAVALLLSSITFLTLYPATVEIFNGFAWLFAAFVLFIPIVAITIVAVKDRQIQRQAVGERGPVAA